GTAVTRRRAPALHPSLHFGADEVAREFPVYASQPGSLPHHATLGSSWSLAFAVRVFIRGDRRKVSVAASSSLRLACRTRRRSDCRGEVDACASALPRG